MARSDRHRIPVFRAASVGLADFRAAYDAFQCACFKPPPPPPPAKAAEARRVGRRPARAAEEVGVGRRRKRQRTRQRQRLDAADAAATLPPAAPPERGRGARALDAIRRAYHAASPRDRDSWNVEHEGEGLDDDRGGASPSEFLSVGASPASAHGGGGGEKGREETRAHGQGDRGAAADGRRNGYCSFVLQDDSNGAVTTFADALQRLLTEGGSDAGRSVAHGCALPRALLSPTAQHSAEATEAPLALTPHYWIFVGRHRPSGGRGAGDRDAWLPGRPEHTDAIAHDGTFHHQLVGSKLWKLRPTRELRDRCARDHALELRDGYEVLVEEGDVFVLNTRLWWHRTALPPGWSASYARDVYLCGEKDEQSREVGERSGDATAAEGQPAAAGEGVGNVEVSWAAGFIPKGAHLIVGDLPDDEGEGSQNSGEEDADFDQDDVALRYHHLVPPTIRRTGPDSGANCKLVILASAPGEGETCAAGVRGTAARAASPGRRRLALETLCDLQEGEEFVLLRRGGAP